MNLKSFGPRPIWFLLAAAVIAFGGVAWAETRDDSHPIGHQTIAAAPDNDDNPRVNQSGYVEADDRLLTSNEQARIAAAATRAVGSGTVTDMEASDDYGTAYEVEVHDRAGGEWDVALDAKFAVVSKSRDS